MIIMNLQVMIHQCQGHHQGDRSPRGQNSVIMMIIMKKSHGKKIVTIIIPVLYQSNMGVTMTVFNLQIIKRGEHKEANHVVPQGLQIGDVQCLQDGHIQVTDIQPYHPS